eukprot:m.23525 g.23525  ORF g.23525 m.23525 type:complete len:561 (-) comp11398_c0_seq2:38-1720(-)
MTDSILIDQIRQDVIGSDSSIATPYGSVPLVYADYTASGRSLASIETRLQQHVLPSYANTHTDASFTGRTTGRLREEARATILAACGGNVDEHAVIFSGPGSTSAIATMISILQLHSSSKLKRKRRPVVFVSSMEHHSNEVSWRETKADVVRVPMDDKGQPCVASLEKLLVKYRKRPLLVGSFSAASNVTGILTPVSALAACLHRHGALACFDYAAAAPYVRLDMQLSQDSDPLAYQDAMFISPHKFVGGPGTPGVLVLRRAIATNPVPSRPGGGTVMFVSPTHHEYLTNIEAREEGGTPDIVGSIRCGLVFELKRTVGEDVIHQREQCLLKRALEVWQAEPNLELLGDQTADKLTITSFTVKYTESLKLHHNFVAALLNDLFGVQARGGCSCAGPYGHYLLHVDAKTSQAFARLVGQGYEGMKPGWCRVNMPYFWDDATADYVIAAVALVAREGWRFLPDYTFDVHTGLWVHRESGDKSCQGSGFKVTGAFSSGLAVPPATTCPAPTYSSSMKRVQALVAARAGQESDDSGLESEEEGSVGMPESCDALRWFPIPNHSS